jgi:predicted anti-sigma-YlaC factor YlaD
VTCQELVELVTDYFEGALDPVDRDRFEAHLGVCPGCTHYMDQMRVTLSVAHDITVLERRPEVASLLSAFRDWHSAGD